MIEHRVLTQDDIDTYPYRPKKPWCPLCSPHMVRMTSSSWGTRYRQRKGQHHIPIKREERVVKATFRNRSVAYYHESCWNDPKNANKVTNIKTQATGVMNG